MSKNLLKPSVCGVGFIGVGKHTPSSNGSHSAAYEAWKGMLKRCYSRKFLETRPTYQGCTVCEEWHNFQNFAEWFESQEHYSKGYQLDKDLLVDGNKVYSPSTCVLVPIQLNNLLIDSRASRGEYPIGVGFHKEKKKFQAYLTIKGKQKHLGYFDCLDDAVIAYTSAKKSYVRDTVFGWQDKIDTKVFNRLLLKSA